MPETMRWTGDEQRRQYEAVARAIAFIRANAARQPELAEVAAAAHLSEFHLQRLFSAWAGLSPKRFLQYLTKEHARRGAARLGRRARRRAGRRPFGPRDGCTT
jgi:AraC family transcriptional regulator of adaptative response/methylated-DNA-[protein]-cysteine methyltransferase